MLKLFNYGEDNARILLGGADPDKTPFALASVDLGEVDEWKDNRRTGRVIAHTVKVLPLTGGDTLEVMVPLANANGEPLTLEGYKVLDQVYFDGLEVRFSQAKGGYDTVVHARATDMAKAGK